MFTPASPYQRLTYTKLSWDSVQTGAGESLGAQWELGKSPHPVNVGGLHVTEEVALSRLIDTSLSVSHF